MTFPAKDPLHRAAHPPTCKCWTETYFYANNVDKCVVIGWPFWSRFELSHWIELYCELSYNCIFSHDLCAGWGPVSFSCSLVAFVLLVWLQTLQDASKAVNINLYWPPQHHQPPFVCHLYPSFVLWLSIFSGCHWFTLVFPVMLPSAAHLPSSTSTLLERVLERGSPQGSTAPRS